MSPASPGAVPGPRRLRRGELITLAGVALLIASLFVPTYHSPSGELDAWDTFGAAVALQLAAIFAGLALVLSALTERTAALPVSTAVWCVPVGLAGVIASVVRLLERPEHASGLATGGWLALAGALAVLAGAWETLRDEHTPLYEPPSPAPRPRP
ncbi:MAG TPA: hypothetical protein VMI13_06710 [Solirubrobacteraceae bacterium]|nr:hypothetical protein [Solirubrobacteraceae bacterium]